MSHIVDFQPTSKDLLTRFLANDPETIRVVTRWIRGVIHCRYHFRDDQADDLAMESLLHVVQTCSKPGFEIRTEFKSLVRVIAARRCMAAINPRYEEASMEGEILETHVPPVEPATRELVLDQYAAMVRSALQKLSFVCQMVLEKKYFQRKKSREIAAELDRSVGTVKANIHRCLKEARQILDRQMRSQNLECQDLFQEYAP